VTKIEVLLVCAFDDDSITVTNHVAWNGYCNRGDAPMFCSITTMQWSQFHSLKNCNKIMRLVLAAAFLANALPVASKRDSTISLAPESHKSLTIKPKKLLIHQKFGEVFTKIQGSRKSQILKNVASDAVQCDPKAVDADVGILSCGLEQYCMESKDSDLGGVCVDRDTPVVPDRKLFADGYYVDVAAFYCSSAGDWTDHLSCDCSKFDNNSKTGSVKCALSESYCFEDASCETCVKLTAEFKIGEANDYAIDWCYDFFLPYEQNVCVEYAHNPSASADCSIDFNDVTCNSCSMFYYDYALENETYTTTCAAFDCANTEGNHVGNLCEDQFVNIPTILDQTCNQEAARDSPDQNSSIASVASPIVSFQWIVMTALSMALISYTMK
jgi:hypothetical protein